MIERWLQINCDRCMDSGVAMLPDLTVKEFRRELGRLFVRRGKRDLCKDCAEKENK